MIYAYFVSYVTSRNEFGSTQVTLPHPIRSNDDIAAVRDTIADCIGRRDLAVLCFTRFDTDGQTS